MREIKEKFKEIVNKDVKRLLDAGKESYDLPSDIAMKDRKMMSEDLI